MDLQQFWDGIVSAITGLNPGLTTRELLVCAGIGMLGGWLASQIVGGKGGIIRYLLAGILGSFLGPVILEFFQLSLPTLAFPIVNEILISTIGATVIVLVARILG